MTIYIGIDCKEINYWIQTNVHLKRKMKFQNNQDESEHIVCCAVDLHSMLWSSIILSA